MVTKLDKTTENVVQLLLSKNLTLSTAESCTGGLISGAVTAVSGSSSVFGFGACTYANEAKIKLLGVKPSTLEEYGAVSMQTAVEMADGIRALSGSDFGISTTGIAGPSGGTEEKPVGTVWIGFSSKQKSYAVKYAFGGEEFSEYGDKRTAIRLEAVYTALNTVKNEIINMERL